MLMPMPADNQVHPPLGGRDYGTTLWRPTEHAVREAKITRFAGWLRDHGGPDLSGYDELWRWSVDEPEAFWASVWHHFEVLGRLGDGPVLSGGPMPDVRWFAGTTLNYARNALRTAGTQPGRTAVIYRSEAGRSGTLSYGELAAEVARVRGGLRELGVTRGDRVAAYAPNIPEALIGLLAAASLGAVWSSCSPRAFTPP
jgi:acetoacetyl-CoA synthetase